ncbi:MAG TPA: COX15/CtaA family protein [Solirubrobacterales bacterium]|nr:COX15/CtaA family protein [Solirubrobacterales bacterium]
MASFADRGGPEELARFRKLTLVTIVATFALVVIGGVVRVSESGLGCGAAGSGTHGWPLCGGRVLPFLDLNAVVEFSHRVAATLVAALIVLMVWRAVRQLREQRWIVRGSIAALVLVLAQAGLGGLTVEHGLAEALVAAHLGLAMLLLGLLIAIRRAAGAGDPVPAAASGALRPLTVIAAALVFATIVAGGYMAGTERVGAESAAVDGGAHLACGTEFPSCLGEAFPFGKGRMVDVHLTHRALMYLAAIAVLAMVAVATRRGVRSPAFPLAAAILLLQILLGALNVWLGEHAELVVAHLSVGTLLWVTVAYAAVELFPVPAGERARVPDPRPQASTSTA